MVIFRKQRIVFVHAPKTGGSAVCRALAYLEGNGEEFDRLYAQRKQGDFHINGLHTPCPKPMPGYTVCCFTREPGSLVQSCYNYAKHRGFYKGTAEQFLKDFRNDKIVVPLSFYRKYGKYGYEKYCDFVGEFEHIEEDFYRLTGAKLEKYNVIPYPDTFTELQMDEARDIWNQKDW